MDLPGLWKQWEVRSCRQPRLKAKTLGAFFKEPIDDAQPLAVD
jgi:hypothetical protein